MNEIEQPRDYFKGPERLREKRVASCLGQINIILI